ncbi:MAG: acyltransferase, partial [Desulfotomaculaceae bacterium]|nr:acyltransferase [Desulfotomaculaceae bacterium]
MVRRYMPGLDGLRALAVFAVIAYHLNLPWAPGGLLGVCIFFVLSGYLITDILLAQWNLSASMNLKDFWLGRARRLLPALLTMLSLVMLWIYLYDPNRLSSLWNEALAAVFYSSNWWLIFHKVSYFDSFGPPSPLVHLWSLAVEEQFYLLWPLLLGLGLRYIPRRGRLIGLITALVIASATAMAVIYQPGLDPNRVYYGTDTRAFALLIGAVLALLWPSQKLSADLSPRKRMTLDAAGGAALLAVLAMIWLSNQYQSFLYYGGLLLFSIISAVLVAVLAHPASRLGRLFGISPLRGLGMWSSGIYLWHHPV